MTWSDAAILVGAGLAMVLVWILLAWTMFTD